MIGPILAGSHSGPRQKVTDGWTWRSDDSLEERATCELCQSETDTSVEYGMRVCSRCERQLLP